MLSRYGLAYLHIVGRRRTVRFPRTQRRFGGPYIANGGYSVERAGTAISEGTADVVSFGTPFLAHLDLVERFRLGEALNAADPATFYQGEAQGYTDLSDTDRASRATVRTKGHG
ncbi:hypothetical protein [Pseudomonas sp. Z6-20]|uniref:hypothetical protein n=1 Tax=unclassified Pseudomonas TaxID=196821 RepID=UPI003DA8696D